MRKEDKILSVKREVKKRKELKKISLELTDINFKSPIAKRDLSLIQKRVITKIIKPFVEKTKGKELEERKDLIKKKISNDENIVMNFEAVSEEEKDLAGLVVRGRNGKKYRTFTDSDIAPVKVQLTDQSGFYSPVFASSLDVQLGKTVSGKTWYDRRKTTREHMLFYDLYVVMANVYIANALYEYSKAKDVREYLLLNELAEISEIETSTREKGLFIDTDDKKRNLERLYEEYNFHFIPNITVDSKQKGFKDELIDGYYRILSEKKGLFNLQHTFFRPSISYNLVKKTPKEEIVLSRLQGFSLGYSQLIFSFFKSMVSEGVEIEEEEKRNLAFSESYAGVTDLKKNIPEKIQNAMKKSKLNKFFGFVQYDELVDLEKIGKIEDEFFKFSRFMKFSPNKKVKFGFRRLGKYSSKYRKVGGIYFPGENYIVVDLDSSKSFVHELMHMIDYNTSDGKLLSDNFKFKPLMEAYKIAVEKKIENLPGTSERKEMWKSKSERLEDYYFTPREIFARTGEIYIKKILNYDTSLIYNEGEVYPDEDKELLVVIEKFFSEIFGDINPFEEDLSEEEIKEEKTISLRAEVVGFDAEQGEQLKLI